MSRSPKADAAANGPDSLRELYRLAHTSERELTTANEAIARLKTVMIAAAEEINAHWRAHCDEEGYGPSNLMTRLERGIDDEYGYTAGAFKALQDQLATKEAELLACRALLREILAHLPDLGQMLNVLETEWRAQGCWSEWDQSVMDKRRELHERVYQYFAAIDAAIKAGAQS